MTSPLSDPCILPVCWLLALSCRPGLGCDSGGDGEDARQDPNGISAKTVHFTTMCNLSDAALLTAVVMLCFWLQGWAWVAMVMVRRAAGRWRTWSCRQT
jgi:hypothetical protein